MESHITLGSDVVDMQTTNKTNYNTYIRKVDRQTIENKEVNVIDKRTSNIVEKNIIDKRQKVVQNGDVQKVAKTSTDVSTDTKTMPDGTIVTVVRKVVRTRGGNEIQKSSSQTHVQHVENHVVNNNTVVRQNNIVHSSSQKDVSQLVNNNTVVRQNNIIQSTSQKDVSQVVNNNTVVRQNNIIHSSSHKDISHAEKHISNVSHHHGEKNVTHHKRNVISSEEINNQILHRKGMHTSTETLHATSASALDMRKSVCNIHDQGRTVVNTDRHSLSSIHRSNQESNALNRRSQQVTYQTVERPQKIVRRDNLSVGGHFYGQSEARSYGEFTKQQNVQRVERVNRRSNISNITLGDSNVHVVTSYKKEYAPRNVGPCPAVLVDAPKGPFKHTRDTKSHKFYLPVPPKVVTK